jgi:hypothetical protein
MQEFLRVQAAIDNPEKLNILVGLVQQRLRKIVQPKELSQRRHLVRENVLGLPAQHNIKPRAGTENTAEYKSNS